MAGSNFADGKGNATVYVHLPEHLTGRSATSSTTPVARSIRPVRAEAPGQPWRPFTCGGSSSSGHGSLPDSVASPTPGRPGTHRELLTDYGRHDHRHVPAVHLGATATTTVRSATSSARPRRYTAGAFLHYDVNEQRPTCTRRRCTRATPRPAQYGPSGCVRLGYGRCGPAAPTRCCNALGELAALCSPANIAANQAYYLWSHQSGGCAHR